MEQRFSKSTLSHLPSDLVPEQVKLSKYHHYSDFHIDSVQKICNKVSVMPKGPATID